MPSVPCAMYGISLVLTGSTPTKNAYVCNSVSLEATDITPTKYHGVPDKAKEYIANITPKKNDTKNETIDFTAAVTDNAGITPWTTTNVDPLPSQTEDGVPHRRPQTSTYSRRVLLYLKERKSA